MKKIIALMVFVLFAIVTSLLSILDPVTGMACFAIGLAVILAALVWNIDKI